MTSKEIRKTFLKFFEGKKHSIVASAPMVIKNDPTLMFTNAGMNQFKDLFLGNAVPKSVRVADTQKCLRVSGKHNDLEEVGLDTYHHTMFEMLGNWSFGDYFKKEAIEWAWEILTEVYKLPKDRLYVTVFEGDAKENLAFDDDAKAEWKKWIPEDRIINGNKKDNFWEMGETGPCGPCSEIHIDLRSEAERKKTDGKKLVNSGDPQVVEIWNNVFMEFNRKADGSLESLPAKHVDTGMGFERLCMAIQGKQSNYDTDVFQPLIKFLAAEAKTTYGADQKTDIALRVAADHIRAISFAIADGQLPSNNKAGYVIRRILRRAVRYGYTFLNFRDSFLYKLVPVLAEQFEEVFPELKAQQEFIMKVIHEEESSFLRTLGSGILKFDAYKDKHISGEFAFELYDTFGFPLDLTELLARERGMTVDLPGFNACMEKQKSRSKAATSMETGDWTVLPHDAMGTSGAGFVGYEKTECSADILKYRTVKANNKNIFQVVLSQTPFYAESGGQVGDTGTITYQDKAGDLVLNVLDTKKEDGVIIHFVDKLPTAHTLPVKASVDINRRLLITSNHSATHLMHAALRKVLGAHVAQKGSLVNETLTRFDFSHFTKITDAELGQIETMVNEKILQNIALKSETIPIAEAKNRGAMALFGEKYGDMVRVITFGEDFSIELCGGTHVPATGNIGLFKIVSESSVAAGVRRVEAITNVGAKAFVEDKIQRLAQIGVLLNNSKDPLKAVQQLVDENVKLKTELDYLVHEKIQSLKKELLMSLENVDGIQFLARKVEHLSADALKDISFEMKKECSSLFLLLGSEIDGKPFLSLILSESLVSDRKLDATKIIRELSKEIQGGGGGQAFYATAGGKQANGLQSAIDKARGYLSKAL